MNELTIANKINIKDKIYQISGKLVITKDINKAAKRNKERFPEEFYFQLTKEDYYEMEP